MLYSEAKRFFNKGYYKAIEDTKDDEKIYLDEVMTYCAKSYKEIEGNTDDYYNSGYAYGILFIQNNK